MNEQSAPVDIRGMVRGNDPETSCLAAEKLITSGKLGEQHQQALDLVRRFPMHTSCELGTKGVLTHIQLARRLPELERMSKIKRCAPRESTVTGNKATTWDVL